MQEVDKLNNELFDDLCLWVADGSTKGVAKCPGKWVVKQVHSRHCCHHHNSELATLCHSSVATTLFLHFLRHKFFAICSHTGPGSGHLLQQQQQRHQLCNSTWCFPTNSDKHFWFFFFFNFVRWPTLSPSFIIYFLHDLRTTFLQLAMPSSVDKRRGKRTLVRCLLHNLFGLVEKKEAGTKKRNIVSEIVSRWARDKNVLRYCHRGTWIRTSSMIMVLPRDYLNWFGIRWEWEI